MRKRCGNSLWRTVPVLSAMLTLWLSGPAPALSLDQAEEAALERDQGLRELAAQVRAEENRAVSGGALPDPELMLGARNLPADSFSTTDDNMTMQQISVRQRFPAGRSRSLQRDRGELRALALQAEKRARELEVRRQVRRTWLDWHFAVSGLEVVREAQSAFEELLEVSRSRFAAGRGLQRDLSRARLEKSMVERQILALERDRDRYREQLARWVGPGPLAGARPQDPPDWGEPAGREGLIERLGAHPLLEADRQRIAAGEAGAELARQQYRPQWMVEVGYGFRRGRNTMTGDDREDLVSGMVSLSIPLFTRNRQDRQVAAAREEVDARHHARGERLQALEGRLNEQLAVWNNQRELVELYRGDILLHATDTVEGSLSAWRSDRATFEELIRARVDLLERELELLRSERELNTARVELLYLSGE